jgi:hypothetical protein
MKARDEIPPIHSSADRSRDDNAVYSVRRQRHFHHYHAATGNYGHPDRRTNFALNQRDSGTYRDRRQRFQERRRNLDRDLR